MDRKTTSRTPALSFRLKLCIWLIYWLPIGKEPLYTAVIFTFQSC